MQGLNPAKFNPKLKLNPCWRSLTHEKIIKAIDRVAHTEDHVFKTFYNFYYTFSHKLYILYIKYSFYFTFRKACFNCTFEIHQFPIPYCSSTTKSVFPLQNGVYSWLSLYRTRPISNIRYIEQIFKSLEFCAWFLLILRRLYRTRLYRTFRYIERLFRSPRTLFSAISNFSHNFQIMITQPLQISFYCAYCIRGKLPLSFKIIYFFNFLTKLCILYQGEGASHSKLQFF